MRFELFTLLRLIPPGAGHSRRPFEKCILFCAPED